jgi:alpha-galactosidase
MRIGADVAPTWLPEYPLIGPVFRPEPDVPSTRNAIQNVLTRLPLHKRWWANDPDCLLLRPETKLSLAEVHSLATVIALSDGMLLLSDDLLGLPQERLRIAQALLPLIGKPAQVLDWFDSATPKRLRLDLENATGTWSLLAIFNWGDYPDDAVYPLDAYGLAAGEAYIARDFWNGERCLVTDGMLHPGRIPVHGVSLLAVRRYEPDEPQYLGGNLHISQGLEVRRWEWDAHSGALAFELERPGRARGIIEVGLPRVLKSIVGDGRPLTWSVSSDSCYRIAVDFQRHTKIQIRY